MAVPRNETKPNGCPDHGATSARDCTGPLNNSVCQEFCPKTRTNRERLQSMPTPTNPLEALSLLLTATAADLDEGKLNTEEAKELWRGMFDDLKKKP